MQGAFAPFLLAPWQLLQWHDNIRRQQKHSDDDNPFAYNTNLHSLVLVYLQHDAPVWGAGVRKLSILPIFCAFGPMFMMLSSLKPWLNGAQCYWYVSKVWHILGLVLVVDRHFRGIFRWVTSISYIDLQDWDHWPSAPNLYIPPTIWCLLQSQTWGWSLWLSRFGLAVLTTMVSVGRCSWLPSIAGQ